MIDQEIGGLTSDHKAGTFLARAPLGDAEHGQDPDVKEECDHLEVLENG